MWESRGLASNKATAARTPARPRLKKKKRKKGRARTAPRGGRTTPHSCAHYNTPLSLLWRPSLSLPPLMASDEFASLEAADGVRLTWNVWPSTRLEAAKCVVPIAAVYSPVKALASMPVR